MKKMYEILFYDADGWQPAYYVIDIMESEKPEIESDEKLREITERVRKMFHLDD